MKNKFLKLVFGTFLIASLTACGNTNTATEPIEESSTTVVKSERNTEVSTENEETSQIEAETIHNEEKVNKLIEDKSENYKKMDTLSNNWKDLTFEMDGKVYQLPFDYDKLKKEGWKISLRENEKSYIDEESSNYELFPDERTVSNIELRNDKYDVLFSLLTGFQNNTNENILLKDADIWSVEIRSLYGAQTIDKFPDFKFVGGITFNSSKDDVTKALGKPDEVFDEHVTVYTYFDSELDIRMEFVFDNNNKLYSVSLKRY